MLNFKMQVLLWFTNGFTIDTEFSTKSESRETTSIRMDTKSISKDRPCCPIVARMYHLRANGLESRSFTLLK